MVFSVHTSFGLLDRDARLLFGVIRSGNRLQRLKQAPTITFSDSEYPYVKNKIVLTGEWPWITEKRGEKIPKGSAPRLEEA